jgi:hypothetical protein
MDRGMTASLGHYLRPVFGERGERPSAGVRNVDQPFWTLVRVFADRVELLGAGTAPSMTLRLEP